MIWLMRILAGVLLVQIMLLMGLKAIRVSSQSLSVEKQGLKTRVLSEHVNSVQSSELKGKYKMRVGESTFEPGGYLGRHHHSGPGIRYVTEGEITSVSAGKSTVYKVGESFYDSGVEVHELYNKTNKIVRVINFEVLASEWKGPSAIPVRK